MFVNNYSGRDIEQRKRALKAGRDYLEKFENSECNPNDPLIPYFKENLPLLEQQINEIKNPRPPHPPGPNIKPHIDKFNKAFLKKDWKMVFATGDEILKIKHDFPELNLDLTLILAAVGYELTDRAGESEYEEKAVYYAELAIKLVEKGEKSDNYGANIGKPERDYRYKTKENALGWMNYIIGYVKYFRQNEKKEAVNYLYKAANYKSEVQNFPELYRAVGDWYFEQFTEVKNFGKPDDTTLKNLLELALDAYARAYNVSKNGDKRELSEKILITYALRYSRQPNAAEMEKITTAVKQKPMPEPF